MKPIRTLILRVSAAAITAALMSACGGGVDSTAIRTGNAVSPSIDTPANSTAPATGAPASGASSPVVVAKDLQLTQYVDPLIGTLASNSPNPVPAGQAGSVIPAAGLPNGMVQWAPDTNTTPAPSTSAEPGSPAGYYYDLKTIKGFSLMHMSGAGCGGNGGEFPVMPRTDTGKLLPGFSHDNEHAAPGYYSVKLDNGIKVELTATLRTGFGRFTYPAGQPSILVLDATSTNTKSHTTGTVTGISANELQGSTTSQGFCNHTTPVTVYFDAVFDQPFDAASPIENGKAELHFAPGATVQMKIGISFVKDHAKLNLTTETKDLKWDFDATRKAADATWNSRLNAIQVTGGTDDDKKKFYTALYHTQWSPSVFSDVDGSYIGFDQKTHKVAAGHAQYTNYSGWDIYRSLIPLKALLFPQETSDMMQSLINDADQCGAIPRWVNYNVETGVMPGDSGSLMVAGGYAFGAKDFDTQGALKHMMTVANVPGTKCQGDTTAEGRGSYLKYHYMTEDENGWGPASSTLEYASTDFAMAQFAGALGNTAFQTTELQRSGYWANLLNTSATPPLITPRDDSGNWLSPDNSAYVEGNAEQYTWMVPHDVGGLFAKLGGNAVVVARLDKFFSQLNAGTTQPNFYMGNEPTFTVPWLYNWAGSPSGTQRVVRQIMTTVFSTKPDGLPGNDDLGAVSGWYVWGALGLYPEIPGVGGLAIGSPQFDSIAVRLGNGKTLQIDAPGASSTSNYVQSLSIDGAAHTSTWLSLDALTNGASMKFTMGTAPSTWGTQASDAPPSFAAPAASGSQ